jgi:hypothetical protein
MSWRKSVAQKDKSEKEIVSVEIDVNAKAVSNVEHQSNITSKNDP